MNNKDRNHPAHKATECGPVRIRAQTCVQEVMPERPFSLCKYAHFVIFDNALSAHLAEPIQAKDRFLRSMHKDSDRPHPSIQSEPIARLEGAGSQSSEDEAWEDGGGDDRTSECLGLTFFCADSLIRDERLAASSSSASLLLCRSAPYLLPTTCLPQAPKR